MPVATKTTGTAVLYTIGYEGLDLPAFIKYLSYNKVKLLVDVRELAFSRKRGFSKTALSTGLEEAGIRYAHLRDLGSPRDVRKKLFADKDYESFFASYGEHLDEQDEAVDELEQLIEEFGQVCIMCFEQNHTECHRSHLADHLTEAYPERFKVEHIKTYT